MKSIKNIVDKIKQEILNEATSNLTGSRGSYVPPIRPGKRIFTKNQLGPYTDEVSNYYSQQLAYDSYDGSMSTPKKDIKKIESKVRKSSIYAKNHPIRNDDDGDVINPFPGHDIKRPPFQQTNKPFINKLNEWDYEEAPILTEGLNHFYNINEADTSISAGMYNGPIELGIRKWKTNHLRPFTEFVDSEINHKKVKSTTKNNIRRTVGMWEKDEDGSYEIETGNVHTIKEDLGVWFGTKKKPKGSSQPKGPWVNICRKVDGKHPPCGRSEADTKSYPKCRAAGVAGKMSDSEKKAACAQKRRAEKKEPKYGTGNKPTMVSYKPKTNESELIRMILKEDYDYPKFSVKNGKIVIDDKYTYQLQGYGGYLIGWLDIPVVELTKSGDVLVMNYKKPPTYFITTDTINPNSIQYIKSNLGKNEIEPPIKEGKPKIRLVKK